MTLKDCGNLLKTTLSAVVIGITLGLLKSRNAAQNGATKNGTFLQKAGRRLEPYFPIRARTSSAWKSHDTTASSTEGVHALTDDHPGDENDLMGDGGARPQQPQGAVALPTRIEQNSPRVDSLKTHTTGWRCSLPSEHAVDDGEEEAEVNNAVPV